MEAVRSSLTMMLVSASSAWGLRSCVRMQCVLTARLVADDDWVHEHVRSGRWQQRRLWLGLSSGKSRKGS